MRKPTPAERAARRIDEDAAMVCHTRTDKSGGFEWYADQAEIVRIIEEETACDQMLEVLHEVARTFDGSSAPLGIAVCVAIKAAEREP